MPDIDVGNVTSEPLRVVFHQGVDEIAALEPAWSELATSRDQPLFFQSHGWLAHVAAIRAGRASSDWRICVAGLWRGDRLRALWPLSLQREGFCWIARALDDPFGQFAGFLVHAEEDEDRAIDSMLEALKSEGVAAGLMIERVPEGSALHRRLAAAGARVTFSDQAVVLDFRPFETFQDYQKTRKAKTRKNLRNALNRLQRDHGVEHHVVTDREGLEQVIAEALEGRLVWMQDRAMTSPAFRDRDFRALIDGLRESGAAADLIGFRLATPDEPVSVQWGFVHDGRYYAFISARNAAYDAYSPGRVHLGMVVETCFERGIEVVEMMAPASDYKLNWTDQLRRIDDFALAFSARGFLYLDLWRRHGRSIARRLYHSLPDGVRRQVAARTNKSLTS